MPMNRTKVAILGAGFITDIHMESYHRFIPEAEVVAVYARNPDKAKAFAEKYEIAQWFDDIDKLIAESGCEVVDICLPNYLHASATIKAAKAGKHIIIEKPLAVTLEEADEMIAVCKANNVKLMYAEELCFAPKYERARQLVKGWRRGRSIYAETGRKTFGPA
jgi:myo-inositol 2-dehydrogenase/D-chiro-inositol 1-dehydrogenase